MTIQRRLPQTSVYIRPTQDISSKTNFIISLCASKFKKPAIIQFDIPTLQLDRRHKKLYATLCFKNSENHALLDTGAVQSAMSENDLRKFQTARPEAVLTELPTADFKVELANAFLVTVTKQVVLKIFMAGRVFAETFLCFADHGNSFHGPGLQYESTYSEGPGSSNFPTVAPLATTGYSLDRQIYENYNLTPFA